MALKNYNNLNFNSTHIFDFNSHTLISLLTLIFKSLLTKLCYLLNHSLQSYCFPSPPPLSLRKVRMQTQSQPTTLIEHLRLDFKMVGLMINYNLQWGKQKQSVNKLIDADASVDRSTAKTR